MDATKHITLLCIRAQGNKVVWITEGWTVLKNTSRSAVVLTQ